MFHRRHDVARLDGDDLRADDACGEEGIFAKAFGRPSEMPGARDIHGRTGDAIQAGVEEILAREVAVVPSPWRSRRWQRRKVVWEMR